jgi:hypothetical protein
VLASAVGGVGFWVVGIFEALVVILASSLYALNMWGLYFGAVPTGEGFNSGMNAVVAVLLVGALVGIAATTVAGCVCGIAQWLVLRRQVYRAASWVLASAASFAGAMLAVVALLGAVGLVVVRINAGMAEILEIWQEAGWLGLVLAEPFSGMDQTHLLRQQVPQVALSALAGALGGAVYGTISGGAMVWLLRQPVPRAKEDAERNHESNQPPDMPDKQPKSTPEK